MCEICRNTYRDRITRRSVLKFTAAAVPAGLIGGQAMGAKKKKPPKPQNIVSPDASLDRLMRH